MTEEIAYEDLLPTFDADNDFADEFRKLCEGIEIAEWALRFGEFNEFGSMTIRSRRYSVRVNGREYESPHVTIRCGSDINIRIFLNSTPDEVAPDRRAKPDFETQIDNRDTRRLLLDFVRTHHSTLRQAWKANGNPIHQPDAPLTVECERHNVWPDFLRKSGVRQLREIPGAALNANLDQFQHPS